MITLRKARTCLIFFGEYDVIFFLQKLSKVLAMKSLNRSASVYNVLPYDAFYTREFNLLLSTFVKISNDVIVLIIMTRITRIRKNVYIVYISLVSCKKNFYSKESTKKTIQRKVINDEMELRNRLRDRV